LKWWVLLILAMLAAAAIRVFVVLRRVYAQRLPGWDEKTIRRLREQGLDPFATHELDFFFYLPDASAAQALVQALEHEGFATDSHAMAAEMGGVSLHARKAFRLSVEELTALSRRFTALAAGHGGRYDGWMAAHAPHGIERKFGAHPLRSKRTPPKA
jgi:hypothetical protein